MIKQLDPIIDEIDKLINNLKLIKDDDEVKEFNYYPILKNFNEISSGIKKIASGKKYLIIKDPLGYEKTRKLLEKICDNIDTISSIFGTNCDVINYNFLIKKIKESGFPTNEPLKMPFISSFDMKDKKSSSIYNLENLMEHLEHSHLDRFVDTTTLKSIISAYFETRGIKFLRELNAINFDNIKTANLDDLRNMFAKLIVIFEDEAKNYNKYGKIWLGKVAKLATAAKDSLDDMISSTEGVILWNVYGAIGELQVLLELEEKNSDSYLAYVWIKKRDLIKEKFKFLSSVFDSIMSRIYALSLDKNLQVLIKKLQKVINTDGVLGKENNFDIQWVDIHDPQIYSIRTKFEKYDGIDLLIAELESVIEQIEEYPELKKSQSTLKEIIQKLEEKNKDHKMKHDTNEDAKTIEENYKISNTCPICMENYDNSVHKRFLFDRDNGHFICKNCFYTYVKDKGVKKKEIPCPVCKTMCDMEKLLRFLKLKCCSCGKPIENLNIVKNSKTGEYKVYCVNCLCESCPVCRKKFDDCYHKKVKLPCKDKHAICRTCFFEIKIPAKRELGVVTCPICDENTNRKRQDIVFFDNYLTCDACNKSITQRLGYGFYFVRDEAHLLCGDCHRKYQKDD